MDLLQVRQGDRALAGLDPEVLALYLPVGIIQAEVKQAVRPAGPVDRDLTFSSCWLALRLSH